MIRSLTRYFWDGNRPLCLVHATVVLSPLGNAWYFVFFGWYSATLLVHATTVVLSPNGNARYFLDGNRPLWYILLRYSATTVMNGISFISYFIFLGYAHVRVVLRCLYVPRKRKSPDLELKYEMCRVCVCFLPIYSGRQIRWKYQPGSHKDFSSTFLLRCVPFFSREKDPAIPFPRRP